MGFFSSVKPNREIDLDVATITLEGYGRIMDHASTMEEANEMMSEVHDRLKEYVNTEKLGVWKIARVIGAYEHELLAVSPNKREWIMRWKVALRRKLRSG